MRIRFKGLQEVIDALDPEIVNGPVNTMFRRSGILIVRKAKEHAPVDSGRMRNSLAWKIEGANPPKRMKAGTNVNNRGFPYPIALDQSSRYHYRFGGAGGAGNVGQQTKGWFSVKAVEQQLEQIAKYVEQLGDDIVAAFGDG